MEIKSFGVIGAGQMGGGIAQVAAASGLDVILMDINDAALEKGMALIAKNLSRNVEKGKMAAAEKDAILGRFKTVTSLEGLSPCDYVVEAATENENLKFKIFEDLDRICRPGVILGTNTSSIPIGRIAARTKRPEKVIGMHFMNPVPVMKLVEIIRGIATDTETFKITWDMCVKFGKTPAEANDFPGFIANRILMPMINEAVFALYQSVGRKDDIDTVM